MRIGSSFVAKLLGAAALVALGDALFWGGGVGSNLGVFALVWIAAVLALVPAVRQRPLALALLGGAAAFAATLAYDPGLLALAMFWGLLSIAALLPRYERFGHVGYWAPRLVVHGMTSVVGPWADLLRLRKRGGPGLPRGGRMWQLLPLPLIGGAVFLGLFAAANPLIGEVLLSFSPPSFDIETLARAVFWGVVFTGVWATLRPFRLLVRFPESDPTAPEPIPGISVGSVTLALLTFNALFALQNGLDLAFLWSGAPLPEGVTLAEYAHQGAYPLIATALLAGLFVLVALRPGSDTAKVPLIRLLVVAWIVQNVFLVASTVLRTIDYVEAYSLTELRIAAMLWMGLVALGLVLVLWRMLAGRSAAWLINANAVAAGLVVLACSIVDLGAVAAAWNVRHAREVGGRGAALDLCYLNRLGSAALVPLVELELRGKLDPASAERVAWVRHWTFVQTEHRQQGRGWTWRNARRIDRVGALLAGRRLAAPPPRGEHGRQCDGTPNPPPPPAVDMSASIPPPDAVPAGNAEIAVNGAAPRSDQSLTNGTAQ